MGVMLMRRLASAVLAAALCFGAAAQESGQLANNHDIALQLQADKKWGELLTHLDKWESEGGLDPIIFSMRTEAREKTGDVTGAIETMRELQKGTPESQTARHADILRELGRLQTEEGDLDAAEKSYRRSIAISETAIAWRELANLLAQKDPIEEEFADEAWRKTLAYGQYINEPDLWKEYAKFRATLDDAEQTYKAFEHVVRLEPDDVEAWHHLFALADELDKEAAQKVIVSRLSRINIKDPLANAYLGMKAQDDGNERLADYHYEVVVNAPEDAFIDKWRARAFLGLAQTAKKRGHALAFYRQALMNDPTLFSAWERAIITLRRMRRQREARIYSEKFFEVRQLLAEGSDLPEDILADL